MPLSIGPVLAKSTVALAAAVILLVTATALRAHEVRPAVADILVTAETVEIELRLAVEPWLARIDLSAVEDTDEAPEAADHDAVRALPPDELAAQIRKAWLVLQGDLYLTVDGDRVPLDLADVTVAEEPDFSLVRETRLVVGAALPPGDGPVTFGWNPERGPLILRQVGSEAAGDAYTGYLTNGAVSDPLPRGALATESLSDVFVKYVVSGFEHIIPKGLDHILFVLGLFFLSTHWRPLVFQVTAFTLAHTVTLALASLEIVRISPEIVEPLIAASIVYVAVENIFRPTMTNWRLALVFGFGLLHGLGFASVLADVGLSAGQFATGLIGFNIGVELGQLAVIAIAWIFVAWPLGKTETYRTRVAIPSSLVIAAVGAFWFVERVFL